MAIEDWNNGNATLGDADTESGQACVYFRPKPEPRYATKRPKNSKRLPRFLSNVRNMKALANAGANVVPARLAAAAKPEADRRDAWMSTAQVKRNAYEAWLNHPRVLEIRDTVSSTQAARSIHRPTVSPR